MKKVFHVIIFAVIFGFLLSLTPMGAKMLRWISTFELKGTTVPEPAPSVQIVASGGGGFTFEPLQFSEVSPDALTVTAKCRFDGPRQSGDESPVQIAFATMQTNEVSAFGGVGNGGVPINPRITSQGVPVSDPRFSASAKAVFTPDSNKKARFGVGCGIPNVVQGGFFNDQTLTYEITWPSSAPIPPERLDCLSAQGAWKTDFPDSCADNCSALAPNVDCLAATTGACDCGPGSCWDGATCAPNPVRGGWNYSNPTP